jgi:hypothetical protein
MLCLPSENYSKDCFTHGYKLETKFSREILPSIAIGASFRRCNHSYSKLLKMLTELQYNELKLIESCRTQNILGTRKNNHILPNKYPLKTIAIIPARGGSKEIA